MSPFELFRRNSKWLMAFLILLAMFAFVVLPSLTTYMQRQGPGGDPVAATYDGIEVRRSSLQRTTQQHVGVVRFLQALAEETIRRGGMPQTPGFQYDEQSKQIQSLGFASRPDENATVDTLRLAAEAQKAGFELDDTAVRNWLIQFTDQKLSDGEIASVLARSTGNTMAQFHLNQQLRLHLLADLYRRTAMVGLVTDGGMMPMPVVTPLAQWQNFLKLNRSATVDAYGVLVADYIDQTDVEPAEAEIAAMYQAGKERPVDPFGQSAEPGFARPDQAKFEFLAADLDEFIEREKAKLTEEQLRAEYERRKAGGDFALPETTLDDLPELQPVQPMAADAEEATTEPEEDQPAGEAKPESPPKQTPAEDEPVTEEPVTEEPASEDTGSLKPAGAIRLVNFLQDVVEVQDSESETQPAKPETEPAKPETEPAKSETEPAKPETEPAKSETEPAKPETEPAKPETEPAKPETEPAKPETDPAKPETDPAKPETEPAKPETEPAKPETEPAKPETEPAEMPGDEASDDLTLEDEPASRVPTFEDVRDEIATDLARPAAFDALDKKVTDAFNMMQRYFSRVTVHESNVSVGVAKAADAPQRPDLKAYAAENGLQHGTTDLVSRATVADTPPGQSFGLGENMNRRGSPFSILMYGFRGTQGELPSKPLLSPLRTVDLNAAKTFITWKTEEKLAYTPELDEVRDEVISAVRTAAARELARKAAEDLVPQAAEASSLSDIVPEDKTANLATGVGPFTALEFIPGQGVSVGEVPQLNAVGEKFMDAVFATETGKATLAPNDAQSVFYVVRPTQFEPPIEELRERFTQPQGRFMATMIGNGSASKLVDGFYDSMQKRTGYVNYLQQESP